MAALCTHNGHEIVLTEDFRFAVTGPAFDTATRYESMREAKDDIDAAVTAIAKQQRAMEKISLPALDGLGNPITIRGIHASRHVLLGVPTAKLPSGSSDENAYPNVPWVAEALKERQRLLKAVGDLALRLRTVRIENRRASGYGKQDYDALIAALVSEHTEKLVAAQTQQDKGAGQ